MAKLAVGALLVLTLAGCSGSSGDEPSSDACTPGESSTCGGPAGCVGYQVCRSDGSGYDACMCPAASDGGAADGAVDASLDGPIAHDGSSDVAVDATVDAGAGDAATDGPSDATQDASVEASSEAGVDASVDASIDASLDASPDSAADASLDAGSDACVPACSGVACGGSDGCGGTCEEASACGSGLHCSGTLCVCDSTSCAGCCVSGLCLPGNTSSFCGAGGASCSSCGSESCSGGACSVGACGTGAWTDADDFNSSRQIQAMYAGTNDAWGVGYYGATVHYDGTGTATMWPTLTSSSLEAMWGESSSDIWAVGSGGTALHWDGASWSAVPTGTTGDLSAVWGTASNEMWAVGEELVGGVFTGVMIEWNGSSFANVATSSSSPLSAVWGSSPTDLWVAGNTTANVAFFSHWDGTAWTDVSPTPAESDVYAMWGSASDDIWALLYGSNQTYPFHWNGTSWTIPQGVGAINGSRLTGFATNDIWAGAYHWNGSAWLLSNQCGTVAAGTSDSNRWSADNAGGASHWNGQTCQQQPTVATGTVVGAAVGGFDRAFVGSAPIGEINGSTVTLTNPPVAANYEILFLTTMFGESPNDVFLAAKWGSTVGQPGSYGGGYHWDGTTWSTFQLGSAPGYDIGVWGTGPTDLYQHIYSTYGGTTNYWSGAGITSTTGPYGGWQDLWGSSASDIWATASPMMHWDGTAWTSDSSAPATGYIWGSASNDVWVASSSLYHYDGTSWSTVMALSASAVDISGYGPSDIWLLSSGGTAMHWDGSAWSTIDAGLTGTLTWIGAAGPCTAWGSSSTSVWRYAP